MAPGVRARPEDWQQALTDDFPELRSVDLIRYQPICVRQPPRFRYQPTWVSPFDKFCGAGVGPVAVWIPYGFPGAIPLL